MTFKSPIKVLCINSALFCARRMSKLKLNEPVSFLLEPQKKFCRAILLLRAALTSEVIYIAYDCIICPAQIISYLVFETSCIMKFPDILLSKDFRSNKEEPGSYSLS